MQEHLKYYCTQNQILTGLENEMDDHDLTFLVLFSLPRNLSWQNIVSTIIKTMPSITFNSVESWLLHQVEVLQLDNPATPPLMNTLRAGTVTLVTSNEVQCANCLRRSLTHKSEDCYSAGGPKQRAKNTNHRGASPGGANISSTNFANASSVHLASITDQQPFHSNHTFLTCLDSDTMSTETQMIIDSGCTTHACPHCNWFDPNTLIDLEVPILVTVGDGRSIQAMALGTLWIVMDINGEKLPATILNILFVPDMSSTLISVTNLTEQNHILQFEKEWCNILGPNGKLVRRAKHGLGGDKLYCLAAEPYTAASISMPTFLALHSSTNINTLHCRLGHLNFNSIWKLVDADMLSDNTSYSGKEEFCEACALGKVHRNPFPLSTSTTSE